MTRERDAAPEADDLEAVRAAARAAGLGHAGDVPPDLAWRLVSAGRALLVDVRSPEEWQFVGHVPGSLLVPWATGTALARNADFLAQLSSAAPKDATLLMLCRSGVRSVHAAGAATAAGFTSAFNVLEGFEGQFDADGRRGSVDGWKARGLPWSQK